MDGTARRTRFEERVRLERDFLAPINQRYGALAPLAGMTASAIESWRGRASNLNLDVDVNHVAALLLEAAARAELLADNSRDVFEGGRNIAPDGMDALKELIAKALELGDGA